jgi:hypothetical protein
VAYDIQTWTNSPETTTPISAARLTHMENGIAAAHQTVFVTADGVTDVGPAIDTVLLDLASSDNSYEVVVEGRTKGTIYINSTVQLRTSNTRLRFRSPVKLGASGRIRAYGVVSSVTAETTKIATGGGVRGSDVLTVVATAGFTIGDYVTIEDDNLTIESNTSSTGEAIHQEVAQIIAIPSSTTMVISHALHHTYDTAANATGNGRVTKFRALVNSSIEDVNVTFGASASSSQLSAFELRYCVNSALRNITVQGSTTTGWKQDALRIDHCYGSYIEGCTVSYPEDTGTGGRGYGASLYTGATHCSVLNSKFVACRHSVILYQGASGNLIANCHSLGAVLSDYDLHGGECVDNLFTDCTATNTGTLIADDNSKAKAAIKIGNPSHITGDHYNVFQNFLITNYAGAAIQIIPASHDNVIRDCTIKRASKAVKVRYLTSGTNTAGLAAAQATDLLIEGCVFEDINTVAPESTETMLVEIDGGSANQNVRRIRFSNCRFVRPTVGLGITSATGLLQNAQGVTFDNCSFWFPAMSAGAYALTANNITGLKIRNCDFSEVPRGFKLTACPSARIVRNLLLDLTETTVLEDAGGNTGLLFRGNEVYGYTPIVATSGTGPSTGMLIQFDPTSPVTGTDATVLGSGRGVLPIVNAATAPSAAPTGGGVLYAEAGSLKWRGSAGTVTTVANA